MLGSFQSRIVLVSMLLAGCGASRPEARRAPTEVTVHGALREIMHGGSAEGRVAIAQIAAPGVIALGALAGLDGEVTILDGEVHTSTVRDGEIAGGPAAAEASAALLVVAKVPAWRSVPVPRDLPADGVEAGIEELLRGAGVDLARATPIVIEGSFPVLDWHVVDGPHAHGAPSGISRESPGAATLVGFYSSGHEGVFTHMGQRTHLHVILPGATGHVDEVAIAAGATLRIPE